MNTIFTYDEKLTTIFLVSHGFSPAEAKRHIDVFGDSLVFAECRVLEIKIANYIVNHRPHDRNPET